MRSLLGRVCWESARQRCKMTASESVKVSALHCCLEMFRTQRNWTLTTSCNTEDHILGCFHLSEMPRTHKAAEAEGRSVSAYQGAGEWLLRSSRFLWGWWKCCKCQLYRWLHNLEYTKNSAHFKWVNCTVPNYISTKFFFKEQKETYFPAHCSYLSMFLKMLHLSSLVVSWKAKAAWWCSSTAMSLYRMASSLPALQRKELVLPGWSTSWIVAAMSAANSSCGSKVCWKQELF